MHPDPPYRLVQLVWRGVKQVSRLCGERNPIGFAEASLPTRPGLFCRRQRRPPALEQPVSDADRYSPSGASRRLRDLSRAPRCHMPVRWNRLWNRYDLQSILN
jgi:hypothetical protein